MNVDNNPTEEAMTTLLPRSKNVTLSSNCKLLLNEPSTINT